MIKKNVKTTPTSQQADKEEKINTPGYPLYPANEDIFNKFKEEGNIDPECIRIIYFFIAITAKHSSKTINSDFHNIF